MQKWKAGIVGATGMVGRRFVSLLINHPWFDLTLLAAGKNSAGKPYGQALSDKGIRTASFPERILNLPVADASQISAVASACDLVFCAVSLPKDETRALEEGYAKAGLAVISNNSACRMLPDVPMIVPEINAGHLKVIAAQRSRLGTRTGLIAVKPNCSIQSYVPALTPLLPFGVREVSVCTYQAVSGAGKTLESWPEMQDSVIPFISGEEEKSEREPMKLWGRISEDQSRIESAAFPIISTQCLRVPVSDGHMAAVKVRFDRKPTREEILRAWSEETGVAHLGLPSAPKPFLHVFDEPDRPQTRLDRDLGHGMAISIGRLSEDPLFDWRFVCLSHNTLRGAAGGAVLMAELLVHEKLIVRRIV